MEDGVRGAIDLPRVSDIVVQRNGHVHAATVEPRFLPPG